MRQGRAGRARRHGITAELVSLEEDVRATLDKVVSGEADAGLVDATDAVAAADDVDAVEIPGAEDKLTSDFAATLEQSEDAACSRLGRVGDVGGGAGDPRGRRLRQPVRDRSGGRPRS